MSTTARRLFVGIAALLVVILGMGGVRRLRRFAETNMAAYRDGRERLAATELLLASLPALEDSAKVLTAKVAALAPRLLGGHTSAEAVADLSSQLSLLANRQGSRIQTVRAEPDTSPAGGLVRVGISVALNTDAAGLARLLGAIASHPEALVVKRVRVNAPGGLAPPSEMETLQVELTVTGWYLPRAAKS